MPTPERIPGEIRRGILLKMIKVISDKRTGEILTETPQRISQGTLEDF